MSGSSHLPQSPSGRRQWHCMCAHVCVQDRTLISTTLSLDVLVLVKQTHTGVTWKERRRRQREPGNIIMTCHCTMGTRCLSSSVSTHTFIDYYCGAYNQCSTWSSQVMSTTFIFSAELPHRTRIFRDTSTQLAMTIWSPTGTVSTILPASKTLTTGTDLMASLNF